MSIKDVQIKIVQRIFFNVENVIKIDGYKLSIQMFLFDLQFISV